MCSNFGGFRCPPPTSYYFLLWRSSKCEYSWRRLTPLKVKVETSFSRWASSDPTSAIPETMLPSKLFQRFYPYDAFCYLPAQFPYLWKIWSRNSMPEGTPKTHPHSKERLTALALTHTMTKWILIQRVFVKLNLEKYSRTIAWANIFSFYYTVNYIHFCVE